MTKDGVACNQDFCPNMPEAAEAQLKIANIHYQQMEKPDRDFTHAMRAQDEYRNLILQFPDSKLVPEAKKRLLEVQEVLAEREFRIGHFYYMRQSYPAAIARLQSVADRYPLYSGVDETLYMLGQAYEQEIATVRSHALNKGGEVEKRGEAERARLIQNLTDHAAQAYSRILTRYPVMGRALDAKARLEALHQSVPRPTKEAVAQNRAEEQSRRESGTVARLMSTFRKRPDVGGAAKTGEPPLADPKMMSASEVVQEATRAMTGPASSGTGSVAAEIVKQGAPPPNQPVPRSDSITAAPDQTPPPTAADPNELKPNVGASADPNELKPNVAAENPQAAPSQVNELAVDGSGQGANSQAVAAPSGKEQEQDDSVFSSSKRNKKKGIRKVVPF